MEGSLKRINVLIRPDQHEKVSQSGLSLSGLLRDLLDDRFSDHKVILNVSSKTKALYDTVISNFATEDAELEKFFVQALDQYLEEKTRQIQKLRLDLK